LEILEQWEEKANEYFEDLHVGLDSLMLLPNQMGDPRDFQYQASNGSDTGRESTDW
jgi:hypothetical protein